MKIKKKNPKYLLTFSSCKIKITHKQYGNNHVIIEEIRKKFSQKYRHKLWANHLKTHFFKEKKRFPTQRHNFDH